MHKITIFLFVIQHQYRFKQNRGRSLLCGPMVLTKPRVNVYQQVRIKPSIHSTKFNPIKREIRVGAEKSTMMQKM